MAAEPRLRTYLTRDEVAQRLRAAKQSRHGARNHAMILLAYRHGLRASELVRLRWSDDDLEDVLRRFQNGVPGGRVGLAAFEGIAVGIAKNIANIRGKA